jgi:hypothetical protein
MGDIHYGGQIPQGKGLIGGGGYSAMNMHCNLSHLYMGLSEEDQKCLQERKYWCFLLSRYFKIKIHHFNYLALSRFVSPCFWLWFGELLHTYFVSHPNVIQSRKLIQQLPIIRP